MKKYFSIICIACFMLFFKTMYSQNAEEQSASDAYIKGDYYKALMYYKKAVKRDRDNNEIKVRLANCYFHMNNYVEAQKYYDKVKKEDLFVTDIINNARLLQAMEKYDMAIAMFSKAISQGATNPLVKIYEESCKWSMENDDDDYIYDVQLSNIKTDGISFGISYFKDGVVFSKALTNDEIKEKSNSKKKIKTIETDERGNRFTDLYYADQKNGITSDVKLFAPELVFPFHEGACSFTPDFKTIYFSKTEIVRVDKKKAKNKEEKYRAVIKIYTAVFEKGKWAKITQLPFCKDEFSYAHPSINENGDMLFFSSNMEGGFGGNDLYVSKKVGGKWGAPENLGSEINTPGNEIFPFINKDGTLYFSSDGHVGYGGYDIYSASYENDHWTNVENMKKTVNTAKDDFAFVINPQDSTECFLSSNRDGDGDQDNIYLVRILPKVDKIVKSDSTNSEYINEDSLKKFDGIRYKYTNWDSQKVLYPESNDDKKKIKPVVVATDSTQSSDNDSEIKKPVVTTKIDTVKPIDNKQKPPITVVKNNTSPTNTPNKNVATNKTIKQATANSFQVQLRASSSYKDLKRQDYKDIDIKVYYVKNTFKLTSGNFADRASANMLLNKLKQKGYKDAFIVNYTDDLLYNENNTNVVPVDNNAGKPVKDVNKNNVPPKEKIKKDESNNTGNDKNKSNATGEIVYSVQFLSSDKALDMKILDANVYKYFYKGAYRYTPNKFTKTVKEAQELRKQLVTLGYKDAFIVAFEVKGNDYVRRSDITVK